MTMLIAATLGVAAFFYVLFVRLRDLPEVIPVSPVQHLQDRKSAIYDSLRDLQFEYRLGKLSDEDYKQNKLALQRELAVVLAEMDETMKRFGIAKPEPVAAGPKANTGTVCPHCRAKFAQPLRFCGECGKAMA